MQREELLKRVGSMQQLAYIRPLAYTQGRSRGLNAYEVKNGLLSFTALADKCLDVSELTYKGINFNFLSKPGLQGRGHYDTNGQEAQRSIMGGLFFTAGLENICAPCTVDGKQYPMHGRIRTTPAEHLCSDAFWDNNRFILQISGEMREGELFGENLILRRTLRTVYGEKSFVLTDTIENQSYHAEPLVLLYHINIGYPLLDEGTEVLLASRCVIPRDKASAGHESCWNVMDAPKDNEPEYVFIHEPIPDENGTVTVCVINEKLGLGLRLCYSSENLPHFMQWKSIASGDYVLGLEPSNSSVYGRPFHEQAGTVHHLAPFSKEKNTLTFTILDGKDEIAAAREAICRHQK